MNPPSPRAIIRPTHHPASPGAHDPGNLLKKKNKTLSTKVQTELRRKQKKKNKEKKEKKKKERKENESKRRDRG